jgi:pantothenate kinase
MDGYHLSDAELYRQDLLHLKGSPLTFDAFGFKRLLAAISSQTVDPVYAPSFDRLIEQPIAGSIAVLPSHDVVVVEGNYLLLHDPAWLGAREYLDEVWHVEIDDAVRIDRLIARHEEFGKTPEDARHWVDTVDGPNGKLIQSRAHTANRLVELSDWVIDGD